MQTYKRFNNIVGWAVFFFALVVYALTMESNTSFWDCGEFISGAYKLEVVHPPGAPFFLMLGRIFTFFAFGDVETVAQTINFLSAASTAFAVLFLFWSFTMLASKIVFKDGEYSGERIIAILGAGAVGAMACTFLDSLWFSAVEGEVYAMSIGIMAFILWAVLRWEASTDSHADKWLLLIAYVVGISTGVHLLSLLVMPVAAAVYYFKKYKNPTWYGLLTAIAAGFILIGVVMKGVISVLPSIASWFDLQFVNSFGLPFNSGALTATILGIMALVAALYWTHKNNKYNLNTILLAFSFILIGFSSYLMVPIRATANPPINMNKPADPFSIQSYLNREQYGDRPLVSGPDYTADRYSIKEIKETSNRYYKGDDKYLVSGSRVEYKWKAGEKMFFPRLGFWQEERHARAYRAILNPEYEVVDRRSNAVVAKFNPNQLRQAREYVKNRNQDSPNRFQVKDRIGFGDNIRFFFKYQLGYMYMRYFLWNFAGRQNDNQGTYANDEGGWISGINFIDDLTTIWGNPIAKQADLTALERSNKSRNKFYFLPLIIGLIGFVYHWKQSNRNFAIVFFLFMVTGIFQLVYHNQPPIEPRERDYVLAGSFYAFTMWIGFGVLAIYNFLKKYINGVPSAGIAIALCLTVPAIMGFQGWDDHDRSGRYTARDFAVNYLESCAPNAILFTQGDNDTYPLWYAQEVEGIRTDIRIVNLSLLGVDWYIDQLRYKMNDADPIKLTFSQNQVRANNRDMVSYQTSSSIDANKFYPIKNVMNFIASEDAKNKVTYSNGRRENFLPTKKFSLPIDRNAVQQMDMVAAEDMDKVADEMRWSINKNSLLKNDLITYDIVANNFFERPIYFAVSVSPSAYLGLTKYFQLEGLTYRIVPIQNPGDGAQYARVRTDVMYDNMMNDFRWGAIDDANKSIYLDENIIRMTKNMRGNFVRLANSLASKNEKEKAIEVLDRCLQVLPRDRVPYDFYNAGIPEIYYKCGDQEKAREFSDIMMSIAEENLSSLLKLPKGAIQLDNQKIQQNLYILRQLADASKNHGDQEKSGNIQQVLNDYQQQLIAQFGGNS